MRTTILTILFCFGCGVKTFKTEHPTLRHDKPEEVVEKVASEKPLLYLVTTWEVKEALGIHPDQVFGSSPKKIGIEEVYRYCRMKSSRCVSAVDRELFYLRQFRPPEPGRKYIALGIVERGFAPYIWTDEDGEVHHSLYTVEEEFDDSFTFLVRLKEEDE